MSSKASLVAAMLVLSFLVFAIPVVLKAPTAQAQSSGGTKTNKVTLGDNFFQPKDILILKGTEVTWTNKGARQHSVTSDANQPESFDKEVLLPDNPVNVEEEFRFTFTKLGTTKYHCEFHTGMEGSVTVVDKFEDPFVNVTMDDTNKFNPELVKLNQSQGIVWANLGNGTHNVVFENESIGALGDVMPGARLNYTFSQNGSFRYRCEYHSEDFETGMVGKIGVGTNLTFPSVVRITFPRDDDEVNGSITVQGFTRTGVGQPPVTSVEIAFDSDGNWTVVDGVENWTYTWDTRNVTNGAHVINVRAMASEVEAGDASIDVTVANVVKDDDDGGGIPAPGVVLALLALVPALLWRRRATP